MTPRTREEETEWYGEGGTLDHEYEQPDLEDLADEFDLTDDSEEIEPSIREVRQFRTKVYVGIEAARAATR